MYGFYIEAKTNITDIELWSLKVKLLDGREGELFYREQIYDRYPEKGEFSVYLGAPQFDIMSSTDEEEDEGISPEDMHRFKIVEMVFYSETIGRINYIEYPIDITEACYGNDFVIDDVIDSFRSFLSARKKAEKIAFYIINKLNPELWDGRTGAIPDSFKQGGIGLSYEINTNIILSVSFTPRRPWAWQLECLLYIKDTNTNTYTREKKTDENINNVACLADTIMNLCDSYREEEK